MEIPCSICGGPTGVKRGPPEPPHPFDTNLNQYITFISCDDCATRLSTMERKSLDVVGNPGQN